MRAVVQRVSAARVRVGDRLVGEIGPGLLVLAAVEKGDGADDIKYIAGKVNDLRIFEDDAGKMNVSLADVRGAVLAVSQFTLCGDCRRGRRPSFDEAEAPAAAKSRYDDLVRELRALNLDVQTGEFQAHMQVELVNDGPVTLLLDSRRRW
ncbi:MAG TPA: D-aminoacyl-tRNA deacylase [Vicinamibacterales bacterium]|nr:D-aminoacyl-tRNA deacylase [Vicinamibacterales bacterium]